MIKIHAKKSILEFLPLLHFGISTRIINGLQKKIIAVYKSKYFKWER
jgi:hypothetical protein